jgi:hypothetical protein
MDGKYCMAWWLWAAHSDSRNDDLLRGAYMRDTSVKPKHLYVLGTEPLCVDTRIIVITPPSLPPSLPPSFPSFLPRHRAAR